MRKLRFYLALFRLFIRRFSLHIFFGIAFGVAVFLLRDKIAPSLAIVETERVGIVGRFTRENLPLVVLDKLSTGITTLGVDGAPQPGLSYSWESREGGRVWVFNLKPGLVWQDGSLLTSRDIKYNFPNTQVLYPNTQTVEFQLQDPYAAFPILVSRPVFKGGLLGNGEWKVERITWDGQFIKELLIEKKGGRNRELYRFYLTEQNLRTAFQLGEIDAISEISDARELKDWKELKVETIVSPNRFVGVFFNTQDPVLQDKTVRQALAYSIDKSQFGESRALTSVSPLSWAYNPLAKSYDYDPEHAKKLFNQFKSDEKLPTVTIATIPSLLPIAENVAKSWREVLELEVIVQVAVGVPEEFQALVAAQEIPPDPDQYSMWHSTQTETNITRYKNDRIDKLLEDGRRTLDQEQRKRIYLDFQRFLAEDLPVIFLYHPNTYTISRK